MGEKSKQLNDLMYGKEACYLLVMNQTIIMIYTSKWFPEY